MNTKLIPKCLEGDRIRLRAFPIRIDKNGYVYGVIGGKNIPSREARRHYKKTGYPWNSLSKVYYPGTFFEYINGPSDGRIRYSQNQSWDDSLVQKTKTDSSTKDSSTQYFEKNLDEIVVTPQTANGGDGNKSGSEFGSENGTTSEDGIGTGTGTGAPLKILSVQFTR